MSITVAGKFWLALLLLVSSLSSAPMASMEQSVPDTVGQVAHAHPLPPARIGVSIAVADGSVGPQRPAPPHGPHSLFSLPTRVLSIPDAAAPCGVLRYRPADPGATPPHCERLPYHANAPPA